MVKWVDQPPDTDEPYSLRIIRTPADATVDAIVTCPEVIGTFTHYVQNRTVPCEGPPDCQHCDEGHSNRWHGYLSCIIPKTCEHVLFEFTKITNKTFANFRNLHRTMRACRFKAHRPSGKRNGRVVVTCTLHDESTYRIPDPPNIRNTLCHIWNVQNTFTVERYDPDQLARQLFAMPNDADGRVRSGNQRK